VDAPQDSDAPRRGLRGADVPRGDDTPREKKIKINFDPMPTTIFTPLCTAPLHGNMVLV
jgi:hypothetical protein